MTTTNFTNFANFYMRIIIKSHEEKLRCNFLKLVQFVIVLFISYKNEFV